MATFSEWPQGQSSLTAVKTHWFSPYIVATSDDSTIFVTPYTDDYNNGTGPWDVTLTTTVVDNSGVITSQDIPIASYTTGYNFHVEEAALADGAYAIFYDSANASNPSSGVDINMQVVDASGDAVGASKIILSDIIDLTKFDVASKGDGENSIDLVYSTLVPGSGTEQVHYQVFDDSGAPVSGESGTIENISTSTGETVSFGTLVPSSGQGGSYIYVRGSGFGFGEGNIGLKYEIIGPNGTPTTSLTGILPPYPADETSMSLLGWTWDRLNPTTAGGANFVAIMRYDYSDSTGEHEAVDVHTMNAITGGDVKDVVLPAVVGSTGLTETRLPDGGFIVGYGKSSSDPNVIQLFDEAGNAVGTSFDLPSNEKNFNLVALSDSRVLVEYPSSATGGNQLSYDVFSFNPPCYAVGTRILTAAGDIPIEKLRVGDEAVTVTGAHRPVRWIGQRHLDLTKHPDPRGVWPVRVSAGAFGEGLPARDLWMSPGHNVFVGGVLMPIRVLVNGASVVQVPVDTVTYWHVELDSHDVILAENLPAESYLDTGNRTAFANGGAFLDMHPDFEPRHTADTCAPVRKAGPEVEAARASLVVRAGDLGHTTTAAHDLHVMADDSRIEPIPIGARRLAFVLPAGCKDVALVSRTFVPSHMDARSSDSRTIGVSVKGLQIDGAALDLGGLTASGWHGLEHRPGHVQRWTSGRAALPAGARLIVVDLAGEGRYWVEQNEAVALTA